MPDITFLILSDSHGRSDFIDLALRRVAPDGVLFAGDGLLDLTRCQELTCPLWAVRGNCDFLAAEPLVIGGSLYTPEDEAVFAVEGVRILLMHGHLRGVKSGLDRAVCRAAEVGADILIFGHTHQPLERRLTPEAVPSLQKPLTLFNPGSMGDWRHASFGTLTFRRGEYLLGHGEL